MSYIWEALLFSLEVCQHKSLIALLMYNVLMVRSWSVFICVCWINGVDTASNYFIVLPYDGRLGLFPWELKK